MARCQYHLYRRPRRGKLGELVRVGIPLRRQKKAVLVDRSPNLVTTSGNELIGRLIAGRCEVCGETRNLEVHHIRKLADLKRPGRHEKPAWVQIMAKRQRKTLITCRGCHDAIHAGRPVATQRSNHWRAG